MPAITRRASGLSPSSSAAYDTPEASSSAAAKSFANSTPHASSSSAGYTITPSATPKAGAADVQPLCPAKLIVGPSSNRRHRVVFSPQLSHTKLFRSTDPLFSDIHSRDPSSSALGSDAPSSPSRSHSHRSASPSVRGILKPTPSQILVAKTAKEGTWNNREAARRIVAGAKPGAFYSTMVLAELCDGNEDGVAGKQLPSDDDPESDDVMPEENDEVVAQLPGSGGSEEEEEEEVECLHPGSLINVILEGADDLLTLEEAYTSLCLRLRDTMFHMGPAPKAAQLRFDSVWQPIADEAPAVVRAIQRDLDRLMGRIPNSEMDPSSSPFRGPPPANSGLPPSPSTSPKKGYSASEVLYRREAAGVGSSVLRLLAVVFSHPRLYSCFSDADAQALLERVLVIMRTPTLPTPFAKRTYTMTMAILSGLNLPPAWVRPFEKKLASAIETGLAGTGLTVKDYTAIRKESFHAASNLLRRYPDIMFPHYQSLLPPCLRAFYGENKPFRRCGAAVAGMFVSAKLQLIDEVETTAGSDKFEWNKLRATITKSEVFVATFLKTHVRSNGKFVHDKKTGEKTTEGGMIAAGFRATIGETKDVAWACTAWAVLASLLGHAYNTCPTAQELDYIMERSLGPSTNAVRPTIGSAAWMHGVYAYLHAGSSLALTDSGHVIRSYSPFVGSSYQDVNARLNTIMHPVLSSLNEALDPKNITRAVIPRSEFNGDHRWSWQRSEKPRKKAWMVTTGLTAPSIVYAYTVVTLAHEDASAAERSRLSGMPSSDGIVPDSNPEELRLPRLDRAFQLVVQPLLNRMFTICGVDEVKTCSWAILEAITSAPPARLPGLKRLLSERYLCAEIVGEEDVRPPILNKFERDRINPEEIPGWGRLWVAKRLGKLLALFMNAFDGIRGIDDISQVQWVTHNKKVILLPTILSNVWRNLLQALASLHTPDAPNTIYTLGLCTVAHTIRQIFEKDPTTYIPICLLKREGNSALDVTGIRLGIALHLYNVATDVLGEAALGGQILNIEELVKLNVPVPEQLCTTEPIGHPTVAGFLLAHLVSYKHFPSNLDEQVSPLFTEFVSVLLDTGCSLGTKLLGDLTNKIPFIFEGCEQLKLDVWRPLALKWSSVVDLEPVESVSPTNYTGGLLTTLLSCPFRCEDPDSTWYTDASLEDLEAWESLLKVTVLRFRAKGAGSNFGVMETLAAHLGDFLRVDDDDQSGVTRARRGGDTTIHCLAEAVTWISLVQKERHHADHYSINENYIPVDFLSLVSTALVDAYVADKVPSKVADMVENLTALLIDLPTDAVKEVVEVLRPGLAVWMTDADSRVSGYLGDKIDAMYVALLDDLTRAIESRSIQASAATMDAYIDLYAPRLSRAQSRSVPFAFQQMWHRAFQPLGAVEYSDDVAGFLRDVLTGVPGFIIAEGLSSLESSEGVFPYAETVTPLQRVDVEMEPEAEVEVDEQHVAMAVDEPEDEVVVPATTTPDSPSRLVDDSTHYDADVSQSPAKRPRRDHDEIVPQSTSPAEADVFGPKNNASGRRRKPRRATRSDNGSSSASSTPGPADTTVIAETPLQEDDTPTRPVVSSPVERTSLFSSASRWLRKVPSLLNFGGSDDSHSEPSSSVEESPAPSKTRRKRRRAESRDSSVVDLTLDSPEPEPQPAIVEPPATQMPTSGQPTPRTRLARQRSGLSRTSTPLAAVKAEVSTPLTRSASRKRETEEEPQSSQRRSKRRRRAPRSAADDEDEDESIVSPPNSARPNREAKKEKEKRQREQREREERARVEKEEREERERLEREEAERLERERLQREEAERIENERLEQERLARLERERLEREQLEREQLERERLERVEKERLEKERLEKERIENERLEKLRLEKERKEKEEKERKERLEILARLEKEKEARLEKERLEKERLEKERLEKERLERERLEAERLEKARLEKERLEQERLEKERLERERLERERVERLEKERLEKERLEKERLEKERREREAKEHAAREERERRDQEATERRERAERERREERQRMNERERARLEEERQRQEEAAARQSKAKTPKGKGKQVVPSTPEPAQPTPTPEISGRFADAPGDTTPRPTRQSPRTRSAVTPPNTVATDEASQTPLTPIKRTAQQTKLLEMVAEAARHERVVKSLTMPDLLELIDNLDSLRTVAQGSIKSRVEEEARQRRRTRSRK